MTEHTQIVRKLLLGEAMPRYSTLALLYGVTFPVRYFGQTKTEPDKTVEQVELQSEKHRRICAENHDLIVEMLTAFKTNQEIADTIDIDKKGVCHYIYDNPDLSEISRERNITKQRANLSKAWNNSIDVFTRRYGNCIGQIMELHNQGISATEIGKRLGICRNTIGRKIRENAQTGNPK